MRVQLKELGEFGLIDLIQIPCYQPDTVVLAIGDDCAVLPYTAEQYQLVSCDLLVEDVHFIRGKISARQLGYKAVAVNLSDVAAMGGTPTQILLSVALPPDYTVEEWQDFYAGVADICRKYQVNVIGGDTTSSPDRLTINVTVLGVVEKTQLHLRRDARPGDIVFVTGPLGGSRAGLALLQQEDVVVSAADRAHLLQCHCQPEPCCAEIAALNALAGENLHALNDISDGLFSECSEIAKASQVALVLDPECVPVDEACKRLAIQVSANSLHWAMTGGEDYQLVGTLAAAHAEEIFARYQAQTGKSLYRIGTVEIGSGVFLQSAGERQLIQQKGYDHFGSDAVVSRETTAQMNQNGLEQNTTEAVLAQRLLSLEQQAEAQRVYRHDLQNHLACLSGLLACGQLEEAQAYLRQMTVAIPKSDDKFYSQRLLLNLLLNQKAAIAEARKIETEFHCEDGLLDFIPDYDLCTLLGNLLDNGLEHAGLGDGAYLYLDIMRDGIDGVWLRMENSCPVAPLVQNGQLFSRKAEAQQHGKGIAQIMQITTRYQGVFTWQYDDTTQRFVSQCRFSIRS